MGPQATKVWFITGCSSGFGAALVQELLSRNQLVIATARNPTSLTVLQSAGAAVLACDVTRPLNELVKIAEQAHGLHGRIDVLINNAGFSLQGTMEELTPAEVQS
jgi:NAD(P)-dependent dehydrogenase (short-subunit alcohol dehydrogenase family)